MKKLTKKEYAAQRAAWTQALADGRVVKVAGVLTSYPTIEARDAAIAKCAANGTEAEIVKVGA